MKLRLFLAVAALQVLVLAFMAGQREWIARTGTPIVLRTAPIDPNDPMRGAFVRLDYEISQIPASLCHGATAGWLKTPDTYRGYDAVRDRVVFASLRISPEGFAEVTALSDTAPASGLFIRGRVQSVTSADIRVRYGIEALFMSKAAAVTMEETARKEKEGAPVNAQVVVGPSGIGVLRGHTWEPLGLTYAFDRPPAGTRPTPGQRTPLTGMTVTLHNYGDQPLAVVDLPDARSFRLVPNTRFMAVHYAWVGAGTTSRPAPRATDVIVLKPGATHQVHLDLTARDWWVVNTQKPGSAAMALADVPDAFAASFRLEYDPPGRDACQGLPNAELIRHVPLNSRAFSAGQWID